MNIHTPIYTADDICELLSNLGLPKWNKKVLCGCGFDTREITNDDLADENVIHLYFEDCDKELPIKVALGGNELPVTEGMQEKCRHNLLSHQYRAGSPPWRSGPSSQPLGAWTYYYSLQAQNHL